ncbi:MAG: hypothetical protein A3F31_03770 [Candidatus Levybacteria bacterium RIFCSPHIGHO2_12_FULL_38_12]|nr:MAG: hypothetical protein A2770_02165 [Candidatus Levybacteria bacterium RIFCSPHIGHO2_01_FULL_38_12]OGH21883.1 MAG: hypothetical protein A3D75_00385 [Candidatus Levybacteria bacterium RIFCSPHIGHO2_02_FULL_37_18]OGH22815.1 MAG: hypothetical protein A3F31_03770 [Candidatus Levybacteria bacterium RIFCSPHIGHO2_12_FULL_38_12]OGH33540.1 MAG: hypothetical protein A3A47_01730 [Candidatus Levybacteria bacterium RIFCSPLOWO2_01_FULL_37_20]OGH44461.1 MAG: hypothetical protein A3J14_03420 [Candidatus Lev
MGLLKTTWQHTRRSPYQTFAAVLIITQTFFVISIFSFIIFASSKIITYFESKPQVTAFFKNEAKQKDIEGLKNQLQANGKVSTVKFVSKQEALSIYKNQNKSDPLLLELVTADILPSSLEISAVNLQDLGSISDILKNSPLVSEVVYQKDIIATLTSWTNAIRKVGLVLIGVLAADSILVMIIIIGIKISQKKHEIEIMKLIGATNWYIRWPFVLEGIFYGILGALVGWSLASGALWYFTPFLATFLKGIPVLPISILNLLQLLGIEVLLAILLGVIASFLAVLRYLK